MIEKGQRMTGRNGMRFGRFSFLACSDLKIHVSKDILYFSLDASI